MVGTWSCKTMHIQHIGELSTRAMTFGRMRFEWWAEMRAGHSCDDFGCQLLSMYAIRMHVVCFARLWCKALMHSLRRETVQLSFWRGMYAVLVLVGLPRLCSTVVSGETNRLTKSFFCDTNNILLLSTSSSDLLPPSQSLVCHLLLYPQDTDDKPAREKAVEFADIVSIFPRLTRQGFKQLAVIVFCTTPLCRIWANLEKSS